MNSELCESPFLMRAAHNAAFVHSKTFFVVSCFFLFCFARFETFFLFRFERFVKHNRTGNNHNGTKHINCKVQAREKNGGIVRTHEVLKK